MIKFFQLQLLYPQVGLLNDDRGPLYMPIAQITCILTLAFLTIHVHPKNQGKHQMTKERHPGGPKAPSGNTHTQTSLTAI